MDSQDKLNIIVALREVALAIEQRGDFPETLGVMQALGTELLVLALRNGPMLEALSPKLTPERLEGLIRREVASIADDIARTHDHNHTEVEVLAARLFRMFDPYLAWNEAINRAMEAIRAAGLSVDPRIMAPTGEQKKMFEQWGFPTTRRALLHVAIQVAGNATEAAAKADEAAALEEIKFQGQAQIEGAADTQ